MNTVSRRASQVPRAAAEELLEVGARRVRTASIAARAGVTESTIFRNYGNLENILEASEKWAWDQVNNSVAAANFKQPANSARETLLKDTSAIWAMRGREDDNVAATAAFYFLRQRREFGLGQPSSAQSAFASRLADLCLKCEIERTGSPDESMANLRATLIANYMSVTWLTWLMMPVGSSDVTDWHDLTEDEAQIGVIMLLDREYSPGKNNMLTNKADR